MNFDDPLESVSLSRAALDVCADIQGADELPVVLGPMEAYDQESDRVRRWDEERRALRDSGLLDGDDLHPKLAQWVMTLAHSREQLALRLYAEDGVARLCLAEDAVERRLLALRGPSSIVLQDVSLSGKRASWAGPVIAALGSASPVKFVPLSAPTTEMRAVFENGAKAGRLADGLRRLGAAEETADTLVGALTSVTSHAEIVAIARGEQGGNRTSPAAVAVYNTEHGRIVASPNVSVDGTVWSTLAPGTDAQLGRAIVSLFETL